MDYTVKLDSFEGPLDLLYQMIKQNEIELNEISLARVTEQFLEYTSYFQSFDLETASQFMVIAGELIQLKTRYLLPQNDEKDKEQDEESGLVSRLEVYEQFKNVADELEQLNKKAQQQFFRPDEMTYVSEEEYELEVAVSTKQLEEIFSRVLSGRKEEKRERSLQERINLPGGENYQVEDRISRICRDLSSAKNNQLYFSQLLDNKKDFMEIVVTLLGLLELVHQKKIKVSQDSLFSEIKISLLT